MLVACVQCEKTVRRRYLGVEVEDADLAAADRASDRVEFGAVVVAVVLAVLQELVHLHARLKLQAKVTRDAMNSTQQNKGTCQAALHCVVSPHEQHLIDGHAILFRKLVDRWAVLSWVAGWGSASNSQHSPRQSESHRQLRFRLRGLRNLA